LFGTFKEEKDNVSCIYGIRGPLKTFNPLWANLHIYVKMLREMFLTKNLKDKLYVLVAPTRWIPTDSGHLSPKTNFDVHNFEKYNPNSSFASKSYAFFQLMFVSLISTVFIELGEMSLAQGIVVAVAMVSTAYCVSLWLDCKRALLADTFRIVFLTGVFLTSFFLPEANKYILPLAGYLSINLLFLFFLHNSFQKNNLLTRRMS
jgi:hypothetical protein